jgi:hypothetical protein
MPTAASSGAPRKLAMNHWLMIATLICCMVATNTLGSPSRRPGSTEMENA